MPSGCAVCADTSNVTTSLNTSRYGAIDVVMHAVTAGNYTVSVSYEGSSTVR